MKRVLGLALAFALTLSTVPASPARAEDTFHAFSTMPTAVRTSLAPLPDAQLATVEGQFMFGKREVLLYILNTGKQEGLRHFLNLLYDIPALTSMVNARIPDHGRPTNVQCVFQLQIDTGGAIQTNVVEVRQ